jgi:cytochrome c-type biogenesis protein
MLDPVAVSMQAVARRTASAPLLVLVAGVLSSFGPCVAPRFIALSACAAQARRPKLVLLAFLCGLVSAYGSFGLAASLLAGARLYSSAIYLAVALGLFAGGLATIVHATPAPGRDDAPKAERTLGGVFLLGASFAFVISPCCTPLVAVILAYTSFVGLPLYGAALLALFAIGHALPIVLYGAVSVRVSRAFLRFSLGQAVGVISGALMLALAAYYALLV